MGSISLDHDATLITKSTNIDPGLEPLDTKPWCRMKALGSDETNKNRIIIAIILGWLLPEVRLNIDLRVVRDE